MYLIESILKNLLIKKRCTFDKYFMQIPYIKSKDDIRETVYITPAITAKNKRVIFITKEIKGNWFDSVKDIGDLIDYISKNYGYSEKEYEYYYHIYIENIKFEQFYKIERNGEKLLSKLTIEKLEKYLY